MDYRQRVLALPDTYYRVEEDVTLHLHKGRCISVRRFEEDVLNQLVADGVVSIVQPIDYRRDKKRIHKLTMEGDRPLDRLRTVAEFQAAFDERGIYYGKYWRKADYVAEAKRYMATVNTYFTSWPHK